jgi:hypothetical protein
MDYGCDGEVLPVLWHAGTGDGHQQRRAVLCSLFFHLLLLLTSNHPPPLGLQHHSSQHWYWTPVAFSRGRPLMCVGPWEKDSRA